MIRALVVLVLAGAGATSEPGSQPARPIAIRWTATQEQQTYGYLVYRARERSGPFLRVSPEIVRVGKRDEEVQRYEYLDAAVEVGNTYYYYVDSVQMDGRKLRLTGVLAKTADPAP